MQHWTIVTISTLLMGAVLAIALRGGMTSVPEPTSPVAASASAAPVAVTKADVDAGAMAPTIDPTPAPAPSDVPPLPKDAPNSVHFGVVLFSYRGAELTSKEARSRDAALNLAKSSLELARENFEEAVKRGDPGSTADAGSIPRGILEPPIEYALFTLKKGEVYGEPLDTPRGYWIIRRTR